MIHVDMVEAKAMWCTETVWVVIPSLNNLNLPFRDF